jgi:hypothetical protein
MPSNPSRLDLNFQKSCYFPPPGRLPFLIRDDPRSSRGSAVVLLVFQCPDLPLPRSSDSRQCHRYESVVRFAFPITAITGDVGDSCGRGLPFRLPDFPITGLPDLKAPSPSRGVPPHPSSSQNGVWLSILLRHRRPLRCWFPITRSPDLHPKARLVSLHPFPRVHSVHVRRRLPFHRLSSRF